MKTIVAFLLVIFVSASAAETLLPEALLCEGPEPLALLSQSNFAGQPASVVIKRADATAKYEQGMVKYHEIKADYAAKEDRIRANYRMGGSNAAEATAAASGKAEAQSAALPYLALVRQCASSGLAPLQGRVLERKPISKIVKIATQFGGTTAELWTADSMVMP